MDENTLRSLMGRIKTIAVVGAKDKPGPVDRVGRYLMRTGFTVLPVHPVRKDVWGLPTYASLADIPVPIDMVNLFRASEACPEHARETLALPHRPLLFWMQQGIGSEEAKKLLEPQGIAVVEDACLMVEYARLFPGNPLSPF